MKTLSFALVLLAPLSMASSHALSAPVQETESVDANELAGGSEAATAETLRQRIRDMRMNLLLGGDQVRRAEEEAVDFYAGKTRSVERRMDDVATELVELRASYDVVLDRALESGSQEALREAQPLRSRITVLESEEMGLEERRGYPFRHIAECPGVARIVRVPAPRS